MDIEVEFVDGRKQTIQIRDFITGPERNQIVDSFGSFDMDASGKLIIRGQGIVWSQLQEKVIKMALVDKTVKIDELKADSYDKIFGLFAALFGVTGKKNSLEKKSATE